MTPYDIYMDLFEESLIQQQIEETREKEAEQKHYEETGEWWKPSEEIGDLETIEKRDELFDAIDLDSLD